MLPLVLIAALSCYPITVQDRIAVPDDASRKAAEKLVRDIFKDDLAKTGGADRSTLIRKLLQQAAESRADAATCYALYSLAQEQAGVMGNVDLLWQAADEAGAVFRVEPAILKEAGLQ